MQEKIIKSAVFLLLLVNGILDWRKGEVSLLSLALFGAVGIGLNVWLGYQSFLEAAGLWKPAMPTVQSLRTSSMP